MIFPLKKNRGGGYTLSEMLITIGLMTMLLLLIVDTSLSIAESHKRAQKYLEMNASAMGAFSRFSRDIRRATSVDEINSVLGASSGKLVLNMRKADGTDDVTTFYLDGDRVKEIYNTEERGEITPGPVNVTNLTFRLFDDATTTAVRVELTVAPDTSDLDIPAVNFYSTYVLRGSYVQ